MKILLRELHDKALEGPLDPRNPPPDRYGSTRRLWERDQFISTWVHNDGIFLNETAEEKELRLEKNKELERIHEAENKWESEEKIRYELLRQQAETEAAKRAEKKIPSSIDISLLGGGWAFLLEFSTVIVIIFTLLILGILNILDGKDISTILAAIAGYVLGKASSGTKQEKPSHDFGTSVKN